MKQSFRQTSVLTPPLAVTSPPDRPATDIKHWCLWNLQWDLLLKPASSVRF